MHKAARALTAALATAALPVIAAEQPPQNLDCGQVAKTFSREVQPLGTVADEAKAIISDPDSSSIRDCARGVLFIVTSVSDVLDGDRKSMVQIADLNSPTAVSALASLLAQTVPFSQKLIAESKPRLAAHGKLCLSRKIDALVADATSAFAAASGALDHVAASLKDTPASASTSR